MKHLKLYEDHNNLDFITDYDEAVAWLEENWKDSGFSSFLPSSLTKNSNGTFDYNGYVYLGSGYKKIDRIAVEFNKVGGIFYCSYNKLVTLEGAPRHVGGSFHCSYNNLVTLEHVPDYVGDDFYYFDNMLTTKDSKYEIYEESPGYNETDLNKIANKFLKKLKTAKSCEGHEARILKALKQFKPDVYKAVQNVADFDLDYWAKNLTKASKHDDIIDL